MGTDERIPADIQEMALSLAGEIDSCFSVYDDGASLDYAEATKVIARALLAERERAAKIAEDAGKPYALHTATGAMMFRAAMEKIAKAIRS